MKNSILNRENLLSEIRKFIHLLRPRATLLPFAQVGLKGYINTFFTENLDAHSFRISMFSWDTYLTFEAYRPVPKCYAPLCSMGQKVILGFSTGLEDKSDYCNKVCPIHGTQGVFKRGEPYSNDVSRDRTIFTKNITPHDDVFPLLKNVLISSVYGFKNFLMREQLQTLVLFIKNEDSEDMHYVKIFRLGTYYLKTEFKKYSDLDGRFLMTCTVYYDMHALNANHAHGWNRNLPKTTEFVMCVRKKNGKESVELLEEHMFAFSGQWRTVTA